MNSGQKIMIVDDDPLFVMSTRTMLEAQGYEIESAAGGEEGLAKIAAQKPDLVLLDVMMDWTLDGVTVSRELMKRPALRQIPIIMVTSIRDSEYRGHFPQDEYLHIDSWLDKPCTAERLISEIESVLARHARFAAAS